MKFIFCLLICFLTLNSAELIFKESHKINKDLKFNIYINNDEYEELGFKVLDKNEKIIYEDNEYISYIDFRKLNEKYIFIAKDTGGTCCSNYVILEIEKQKLKNITNLDFGNCSINSIFVNKKNELEFTTCDSHSLDEITPKLIFKDFKINIEKMKKAPPTKNELNKILNIIKKDTEKYPNYLKYFMMDLIYSGNINSAFTLYYKYDKLFPNERNLVLLNEIFTSFKNSRFFSEILNINNISVLEFENLMKKNKIVFEEY